ncbi:MAG: hypothetical protein COW12_04230, partial [Candidatus Omnitrophica bacterium CG12_big_fil_rev_8_21_14_0_65_45_16]
MDLAQAARSFTLPSELGRVEEVFVPGNGPTGDRPQDIEQLRSIPNRTVPQSLIFYIQDAHVNYDAQAHIRDIIRYLQKTYPLSLVMLEGGEGELDALPFQTFPDETVKADILETYLKNGDLHGSEIAAILDHTNQSRFVGIDQQALYKKNKAAFLHATAKSQQLSDMIGKRREALRAALRAGANIQLNAYLDAAEAFYGENSTLLDYLRTLRQFSHETFASYPEIGTLLRAEEEERVLSNDQLLKAFDRWLIQFEDNFLPAVPREQKMKLGELIQAYRTQQAAPGLILKQARAIKGVEIPETLQPFLAHTETLMQIKGTRIFVELKQWEGRLTALLVQSEQEASWMHEWRRIGLLNALVRLELTLGEWHELTSMGFDESARALYENHIDFYEIASERDQAMYRNIQHHMEEKGPAVYLLVTGGFHSRPITDLFKQTGMPYVLISPVFHVFDAKDKYVSVMKGERSFQSNGTTQLWGALVKDFIQKAVQMIDRDGSYQKGTVPILLKTWRDQMIRQSLAAGNIAQTGIYTRYIDEAAGNLKIDHLPMAITDQAAEDFLRQLRSGIDARLQLFSEGVKSLWDQGVFSFQALQSIFQQISGVSTSYLAPELSLIRTTTHGRFNFPGRVQARSELRTRPENVGAAVLERESLSSSFSIPLSQQAWRGGEEIVGNFKRFAARLQAFTFEIQLTIGRTAHSATEVQEHDFLDSVNDDEWRAGIMGVTVTLSGPDSLMKTHGSAILDDAEAILLGAYSAPIYSKPLFQMSDRRSELREQGVAGDINFADFDGKEFGFAIRRLLQNQHYDEAVKLISRFVKETMKDIESGNSEEYVYAFMYSFSAVASHFSRLLGASQILSENTQLIETLYKHFFDYLKAWPAVYFEMDEVRSERIAFAQFGSILRFLSMDAEAIELLEFFRSQYKDFTEPIFDLELASLHRNVAIRLFEQNRYDASAREHVWMAHYLARALAGNVEFGEGVRKLFYTASIASVHELVERAESTLDGNEKARLLAWDLLPILEQWIHAHQAALDIEAKTNLSVMLNVLVHYWLTKAAYRTMRPYAELAIEMEAENAHTILNLAAILAESGEIRKARHYRDQIERLNPKFDLRHLDRQISLAEKKARRQVTSDQSLEVMDRIQRLRTVIRKKEAAEVQQQTAQKHKAPQSVSEVFQVLRDKIIELHRAVQSNSLEAYGEDFLNSQADIQEQIDHEQLLPPEKEELIELLYADSGDVVIPDVLDTVQIKTQVNEPQEAVELPSHPNEIMLELEKAIDVIDQPRFQLLWPLFADYLRQKRIKGKTSTKETELEKKGQAYLQQIQRSARAELPSTRAELRAVGSSEPTVPRAELRTDWEDHFRKMSEAYYRQFELENPGYLKRQLSGPFLRGEIKLSDPASGSPSPIVLKGDEPNKSERKVLAVAKRIEQLMSRIPIAPYADFIGEHLVEIALKLQGEDHEPRWGKSFDLMEAIRIAEAIRMVYPSLIGKIIVHEVLHEFRKILTIPGREEEILRGNHVSEPLKITVFSESVPIRSELRTTQTIETPKGNQDIANTKALLRDVLKANINASLILTARKMETKETDYAEVIEALQAMNAKDGLLTLQLSRAHRARRYYQNSHHYDMEQQRFWWNQEHLLTEARDKVKTAITLLEQKNRQAASWTLSAVASRLGDAYLALDGRKTKHAKVVRQERGRRFYWDQNEQVYKLMRGGQRKQKVTGDKAKPIAIRVYREDRFDNVTEALRSVDHESDSEFDNDDDMTTALKVLDGLDSRLAKAQKFAPHPAKLNEANLKRAERGRDSILEDLMILSEVVKARWNLEKEIAGLAVQAAMHQVGLMDWKAASETLAFMRRFIKKRLQDVAAIIDQIEAGRLYEVRATLGDFQSYVGTRITVLQDLLRHVRFNQPHDEWAYPDGETNLYEYFRKEAYKAANFLKNRKEPDLKALDGTFRGIAKSFETMAELSNQGKRREASEMLEKIKHYLETAQRRLQASMRSHEFMIDYRRTLRQLRLHEKGAPQFSEEEHNLFTNEQLAFRDALERFYKIHHIDSEREKITWLYRLYRQAFISHRIPNPENKKERIDNPAYKAFSALIYLLETGDVAALLSNGSPFTRGEAKDVGKFLKEVTQGQMHLGQVQNDRGAKNVFDLSQESKQELINLLARIFSTDKIQLDANQFLTARDLGRGIADNRTLARTELRVNNQALLDELKLQLVDEWGHISYQNDYEIPVLLVDLWVVPHGITDENARGESHSYDLDPPINAEGVRQAQEGAPLLWSQLGDRLKHGEEVIFMRTNTIRTEQTAEPFVKLAASHGMYIHLIEEPRAAEIDFGFTQAEKNEESVRLMLKAYQNYNALTRTETGENYLQFLKRVRDFIRYLNENYAGKTVVLYGHRTFATALLTLFRRGNESLFEPYLQWKELVSNQERGKAIHFPPNRTTERSEWREQKQVSPGQNGRTATAVRKTKRRNQGTIEVGLADVRDAVLEIIDFRNSAEEGRGLPSINQILNALGAEQKRKNAVQLEEMVGTHLEVLRASDERVLGLTFAEELHQRGVGYVEKEKKKEEKDSEKKKNFSGVNHREEGKKNFARPVVVQLRRKYVPNEVVSDADFNLRRFRQPRGVRKKNANTHTQKESVLRLGSERTLRAGKPRRKGSIQGSVSQSGTAKTNLISKPRKPKAVQPLTRETLQLPRHEKPITSIDEVHEGDWIVHLNPDYGVGHVVLELTSTGRTKRISKSVVVRFRNQRGRWFESIFRPDNFEEDPIKGTLGGRFRWATAQEIKAYQKDEETRIISGPDIPDISRNSLYPEVGTPGNRTTSLSHAHAELRREEQKNIPALLKHFGKEQLQGLTIYAVARFMQVSYSGLHEYLHAHPSLFRQYGIKRPKSKGVQKRLEQYVKKHGEDSLKGLSITRVQRRLRHVSYGGLARYLRNHSKIRKKYGIRPYGNGETRSKLRAVKRSKTKEVKKKK